MILVIGVLALPCDHANRLSGVYYGESAKHDDIAFINNHYLFQDFAKQAADTPNHLFWTHLLQDSNIGDKKSASVEREYSINVPFPL